MKRDFAGLAGKLDVLHPQLLFGNHRRAKDGGSMAAARPGAWSMFGPEGVNSFWPFISILVSFRRHEGERVEIGLHALVIGAVPGPGVAIPATRVPAWTFCDVERLD